MHTQLKFSSNGKKGNVYVAGSIAWPSLAVGPNQVGPNQTVRANHTKFSYICNTKNRNASISIFFISKEQPETNLVISTHNNPLFELLLQT